MGDGREKWDERDVERGWCSHCVKLGDHTKQERSWLPGVWRSAYKCTNCGKRTLPCVNECGAAAKGDWHWDDHYCLVCEGTIVSWPTNSSYWPSGAAAGPRNRSTHSAAVARRGGGGEGGGGARVSVDEAVGAAQSAFELFLDCLASPEPDPHLLSTVARSVEESKKQLEVLINRTDNEEALCRLLEAHTDLTSALSQYEERKATLPTSDPAAVNAGGGADGVEAGGGGGGGGGSGSGAAAAAVLDTEAIRGAAEGRAAQLANRGKVLPKPKSEELRKEGGGAADADAATPATPADAATPATPADAATPATPAETSWSKEAKEAFKERIEESLSSVNLNEAPAHVCAPSLLSSKAIKPTTDKGGGGGEGGGGGAPIGGFESPSSPPPPQSVTPPANLQGDAEEKEAQRLQHLQHLQHNAPRASAHTTHPPKDTAGQAGADISEQ